MRLTRRHPTARPLLAKLSLAKPLLAILLLATVLGCGHQGDPLPPQRFVPAVTQDLTVAQQGRVLVLRFGYPQSTSAGDVLPGLETVEVWRWTSPGTSLAALAAIDPLAFARGAVRLLVLRGAELEGSVVGSRIELRLPLEDGRSGVADVFAVKAVATTGEASDFSNLAPIVTAAAPPPPTDLVVAGRAEGIELRFVPRGGELGFQVYRRASTERRYLAPLARLDADARQFLDSSAKFGERYFYTVRSIVAVEPQVESDATAEIELEYLDRFPPSPPASVVVLPVPGGARLVIEASPSGDAAGYHVYRQDRSQPFRRLTQEPIAALEYQDSGLVSGQTYRYRVSAVDTADNEGEPGAEVVAVIP